MCNRIIISPSLKEFKEFLRSSFLKKAHQGTFYSLHLSARNFGDLAFAINKTTCNLLKFEIAGDFGVHENLCELARGNDELGNEVDVVVTVASKLSRRLLTCTELAIKLQWIVASATVIPFRRESNVT